MSSAGKAGKLYKLFNDVVNGSKELTRSNYDPFLEAIQVSQDLPGMLSRVISSEHGLPMFQKSFRFDVTISFFNGRAASLLKRLADPLLDDIAGGTFVHPVISTIVDPPIFWDPLIRAFTDNALNEEAQVGYLWLLFKLLTLPTEQADKYRTLANDDLFSRVSSSPSALVRPYAAKLRHIMDIRAVGIVDAEALDGPGGRHDNDFADFRKINIVPTPDELLSKETPFLRTMQSLDDPEAHDTRVGSHLDNQFRLYREDMLYEMREDVQISLGMKKARRRAFQLEGIKLIDIYIEDDSRNKNSDPRPVDFGLTFLIPNDLPQLKNVKPGKRMKHLTDNPDIIRHQSLSCIVVDDNQVVAFPTIYRDLKLLSSAPSAIVLQFDSEETLKRVLTRVRLAGVVKLVYIDTALFAYEPVLVALQEKLEFPLSEEIVQWKDGNLLPPPPGIPRSIVTSLQMHQRTDLQGLLQTTKPVILDRAQTSALLSGLTQRLSLIQGPPGTGKSFVGALLAKVLHDHNPESKILVVCYTNHALDQFLEDMMDIGISKDSMVRLGGNKCTPRTEDLLLQKVARSAPRPRRGRMDWDVINHLKSEIASLSQSLTDTFQGLNSNATYNDVLVHLQFEHEEYFDAFKIPASDDDMHWVGKKGKAIDDSYLLHQWASGWDAGIFSKHQDILEAQAIWGMHPQQRRVVFVQWLEELMAEQVESFAKTATHYNQALARTERVHADQKIMVLRSKRIIGCTTTAAAKYRLDIQAAAPTIVLVEEAGEILESHILTAMGLQTKQLILIGDHQQLRPKVNNYQLTVEKGEGYDLNRSLFERLVLKGYPHATLLSQHRMRPEISSFVRQLTYPNLQDAPSTKGRADIRGLQSNVTFIAHNKPEDEDTRVQERRDGNAKSSKQNSFEAKMILKIVKYLGQQGYGTGRIVVLTPYLGQLRQLQELLRQENDPVLNDLDTYDLVQAGLLSPAAVNVGKKNSIRLATIDNYQGEESDIVIASLTRSNPNHDIGFMSAPERLNVLLSRARDGMIILGNIDTFQHARKGGTMWQKFFTLLKQNGQIVEGLKVKCERHPTRLATLCKPEDFEEHVPDGGCKEPCGIILSCGKHTCPSKCHQLSDHSKMTCAKVVYDKCPDGHKLQWKCSSDRPLICSKCERQKKQAEAQKQAEFARQEARDALLKEHLETIARIEKDIADQRSQAQDARAAREMKEAIERKQQELEEATRQANEKARAPRATTPEASFKVPSSKTQDSSKQSTDEDFSAGSAHSPVLSPPSNAKLRWEHQKDIEGAMNAALDEIMGLSGLEEVKEKILSIKDKVDTSMRQGISLSQERFSVSMLGNPGTGKTTVARLYAKFLASVDVVPGNAFKETTGSKLANDGVQGIRTLIDEVAKEGGGVIFIDEAYQLTASHNFEGKKVLDFLLAEMEDQVGKIVFAFAGYEREMEKFFEHNPGIPSRVPYNLNFKDYADKELLDMLANHVKKAWGGRMAVEGGILGLYGRICIRRLGRGRGRQGFGNARAVANVFSGIKERQSVRLAKERASGQKTNDFLITKEDLIGPDPATVMTHSPAWKKLQGMIGLGSIKSAVQNLFDMTISNYKRELQELEPHQVSLNRCYVGNPGTGKTSVAKIYGQILSELGLLSKGNEIVVKNPADFIGSALGESEKNTKAILDNTVGKVLIIDEAYMLYNSSSSGGDPYRTAVIDTIVAEVQSIAGEDRCVLLLGYKVQMEEMFQKSNPGLARRFEIENAFEFADYASDELRQALDNKLKEEDLTATNSAKDVAMQVLDRERARPNFGNMGAINNLLSSAKQRYQQRQSKLPISQRSPDSPFVPADFDPDFQRHENAGANLSKLFEDVIGSDAIVRKIEGWQRMSQNLKEAGKDVRDLVPTTFVFKGPAGTGKTTTARKMGQVYYDMGILAKAEVIECTASDLVGQYVGQTGPKTVAMLEKALGKVLFIDEAYRLSEGHFAQEAMDELVGCLTQERFKGKLIVILAGYDREMNALMAVNSGLSSRFPEEIIFQNIAPEQCIAILQSKLKKNDMRLAAADEPKSPVYSAMMQFIRKLSQLPGWGNARDVETLAKSITGSILSSPSPQRDPKSNAFVVPEILALQCLRDTLNSRRERASNLSTDPRRAHQSGDPTQTLHPSPPSVPPPPTVRIAAPKTREAPKDPALVQETGTLDDQAQRDPGVSDADWQALNLAKRRVQEEEKRRKADLARQQLAQEAAERKAKAAMEELKRRERENAAHDELMRLREKARLEEAAALLARAKQEAARRAEEERQREEARVQKRIRDMGVCPVGYRWIKQSSGYRCAGGSHWLSNEQLGI